MCNVQSPENPVKDRRCSKGCFGTWRPLASCHVRRKLSQSTRRGLSSKVSVSRSLVHIFSDAPQFFFQCRCECPTVERFRTLIFNVTVRFLISSSTLRGIIIGWTVKDSSLRAGRIPSIGHTRHNTLQRLPSACPLLSPTTTSIAVSNGHVISNETRLMQSITDLASNAYMFTFPGGRFPNVMYGASGTRSRTGM